jgi:hypothetical protein
MLEQRNMKRALVLPVVLLLAACGSSGGGGNTSATQATSASTTTASTTTTTSTASTSTSTSTTTTTVAGPPPCTASTLALSFLGQQGGMGHGEIGFQLRNTSSTSCRTYGWPGIQFLDQSGAPLPTIPHHTTSDFFGNSTAIPLVIAPGDSASFRLDVGGPGRPHAPRLRHRVRAAGDRAQRYGDATHGDPQRGL